MTSQMTLQKDRRAIMRRIYAVWVTRHFLSPFSVKCYIFLILALNLLATISIGSILTNVSAHDVSGFVVYMHHAFINTELIVQTSIVLVLIIAIFLIKDMVRGGGERNNASAVAHKFA